MTELSPRQLDTYLSIAAHVRRTGRMPTIRYIGAELGIRNTNGVMCHLQALEKKGLLRRRQEAREGAWVFPCELVGVHLVPAFEPGAAGRVALALWKKLPRTRSVRP